MSLLKGWNENLMLSLFTKEATYDAGVTVSPSNFCSMKGYEFGVEWPDIVASDKDEVTGREHGTDQAIIEKRFKATYKEPKAKPNTVAGLGALVLGSITSTKDGAYDAWKHKIVPVTVGTALPSIHAIHERGGVKYGYKGIRGKSLKISGQAGGAVSMEAELIGSGTRASDTSIFEDSISESWLFCNLCKVWMEDGSDISITATLVQDAEDISSATPADLKARLKSFEWAFNNNLEEVPGFGGAGVLQDLDYGRRSVDLKFTLTFADETELNHYLDQNPLAIEFDLKGALIATGGTMYYGLQLIVPRFKLKSAPLPVGGVKDTLTCEFGCDVQDDGTNAVSILEVYNAKSAYLA